MYKGVGKMNTAAASKKEDVKGFAIHGIVTLCVAGLLAFINIRLTPSFLWFLFPLAGMSVGLAVHYFLGVKRAK